MYCVPKNMFGIIVIVNLRGSLLLVSCFSFLLSPLYLGNTILIHYQKGGGGQRYPCTWIFIVSLCKLRVRLHDNDRYNSRASCIQASFSFVVYLVEYVYPSKSTAAAGELIITL